MDLTEVINRIIENSYSEINQDEEYQSTFSNEGDRKATYIIDDLHYKESRNEIVINKLCYLSIGGSDGSEVEKILTKTEINIAILIEISDAAVQIANEKAKTLSCQGKNMIVLQGDAFDRLEDSLIIISEFVSKNLVNGLVVSAQAVLHELPQRSKSYNLPVFLGKLYREPKLDYCLFYSREPCDPLGWNERVRIRINDVENSDLYRLVCHVKDRLKITGSPEKLASNWLDVESILAIESLHKLLRSTSIKRIEYELGEQLTGFNPIEVKRNLESCVEGMNVSLEYIITLGFKRALINNKVEYVGHNSELLPMPQTHVEIIGFKSKIQGPIEIEIAKIKATDTKKLIELPPDFSNPFDGEISNEKIINWINQFEIEEIPYVLKLVNEFTFISSQKLKNQCKILYDRIQTYMGEGFSNVLFVPFGRPSKSSGIITYYFRTINKISEDKFLSPNSILTSDLTNKSLVFIDDLLASGHQALNELSPFSNHISNKMYLAVIVACEQGIEFLLEKTNVGIISTIEIKRTDNPLHEKNIIFKDAAEKEKIKQVLFKYGNQGSYRNPLGYAGTSLLLGFTYTIPDNTFPIFWSSGENYESLLNSTRTGRENLVDNDSYGTVE